MLLVNTIILYYLLSYACLAIFKLINHLIILCTNNNVMLYLTNETMVLGFTTNTSHQ